MADRTFVGDPNPPADSSKGAVATAPRPARVDGTDAPAPVALATEPVASDGAEYSIVPGEKGGHEIFFSNRFEAGTSLGMVNVDDKSVKEILGAIGHNTVDGTIPEAAAKSLLSGRLAFPEAVAAQFSGGETGVVRAYNAMNFLDGKASREDVIARNNADLLKEQLRAGGQPDRAWSGGVGHMVAEAIKHPIDAALGTGRFTVEQIAAMLPMAMEVSKGAAEGSATVGGGALLAAAATGTIELPPVAAGVLAAFGAGSLAGASRTLIKLETGGIAATMLEQGYDDKTIKEYAAVGGAIKGALWMVGFKFLPAPLQAKALAGIVDSPVFQNWMVKYGAEVAAGTGIMVTQEKVRQVLNNMAAAAHDKPQLLIPGDKGVQGLIDAGFTGLAVMGAMGAVHPIAEAVGKKLESRVDKVDAAKMDAKIKEEIASRVELPKAAKEPVAVDPAKAPEAAKPVEPAPVEPKTASVDEQMAALIDGYEKDHVTADEVVAGMEDARLQGLLDANEPSTQRTKTEQKITEVATAAAQAAREAENNRAIDAAHAEVVDVEKQLDARYAERVKAAAAGKTVKPIDTQIAGLLKQKEGLIHKVAELEAPRDQTSAVDRKTDLSMNAATLADVVEHGFKQGGDEARAQAKAEMAVAQEEFKAAKGELRAKAKERLDAAIEKHDALVAAVRERPRVLKAIATENGLTGAEVKRLLSNKTPALMTDGRFAKFVEEFRGRAEYAAEWKKARAELETVRREKLLVHEQRVKELHGLPPIREMDIPQLKKYAEILRSYDKGDEALSPARVKALEGTKLEGARTMGEVREKSPALTGRPVEDFNATATRVNPRDYVSYDTVLARKNPLMHALVSVVKENVARGEALFETFRKEHHDLAAAAIASRRALQTAGARVSDWLAPMQREIFAFIEEQNPAKKEKLAAALTPEETALAHFYQKMGDGWLEHLQKTGALQESAYSGGNYAPHIRRPLSEILRGIPDVGVKKTLAEIWKSVGVHDEASAPAMEISGPLALQKGFKFSAFRTGELTPSQNLVKAFDAYARQFYTKMAVDAATPAMETLAMSLKAIDKAPDAEQFHKEQMALIRAYLNAKKGNAASALPTVMPRGGAVESFVRFGQNLMSLKYIAANAALQVTAPIGEQMGAYMALGNRGMLRAAKHLATPEGRALLEKYKAFTGDGPLEQLGHPGRNFEDNVKTALYGTFQGIRKMVMSEVLLGSVTKEELKSGVISDARLAEIKLQAGRWIDIHGSKSIVGSSVAGAEVTQFKGWAIPPLHTVGSDLLAILEKVESRGEKPLPPEVFRDFYHAAAITGAAVAFRSMVGEDQEDDTFLGRSIHYARREVTSLLQAIDPTTFASAGVFAGFLGDLAKTVKALATLEEYQSGEHEGEKKGPDLLLKQATPAIVKQFQRKED